MLYDFVLRKLQELLDLLLEVSRHVLLGRDLQRDESSSPSHSICYDQDHLLQQLEGVPTGLHALAAVTLYRGRCLVSPAAQGYYWDLQTVVTLQYRV